MNATESREQIAALAAEYEQVKKALKEASGDELMRLHEHAERLAWVITLLGERQKQ